MKVLKKLNQKLDQGEACVLATVIEKQGEAPLAVGGKLLLDAKHHREGTIAGGDLEKIIIEKCKEILKTKENELILYNLSKRELAEENIDAEMICGGYARIYFEYYQPLERLFIFGGAGNVGKEIAKKAVGLNFDIVVVDKKDPNFDFDHQFYSGHKEILDLNFTTDDYFIIATGNHRVDYEILKDLTARDIEYKYMGMLASKKKIKEIYRKLEESIQRLPKKLYSPIGLNVGGPTPSEIAVGILAQILSIRYGVTQIEDLGLLND